MSVGGRRVDASLPAPILLVFVGLIVAVVAAVFTVAVLGTLLIWLLLIAAFGALVIISSLVRRYCSS